MELTPGQRKAAFAVIVLALIALGAFLIVSRLRGSPAAPSAAGAASSPPAAGSTSPASPVPSATPAAATPAATRVDIYRLLPFSKAALDQAVSVTQKFAAQYGTYSYRQTAAAYAAAMRGLATPELAATLARSYATPGVAQARTQQRQVSSGQGTVTALRAFGPTSLTFVVTLVQRITQRQGRSQQTGRYAITVTSGGGGWQVDDIQLATAGNS
jgi:hypothetical protein